MASKICNRCKEEKYFSEFYSYTNGNYKSICKQCENHNKSKTELFKCETCNMIIRQKNKTTHMNSYRHQKCRFWSEEYDTEKLQNQNRRR